MLPLHDQVKAVCRQAELGVPHAMAEYRAILSVVHATLPKLLAPKPQDKNPALPPLHDLPEALQQVSIDETLRPLFNYLYETPKYQGQGYARKLLNRLDTTKRKINYALKRHSLTLNKLVDQFFILHAEQALKASDDPIEKVAERLNIGPRQFTRKFQSLRGITPDECRRQDK